MKFLDSLGLAGCSALMILLALIFPATVRAAFAPYAAQKTVTQNPIQAVVQWANRAAEGLCQSPATHLVEQLNADAASPASSITTWLKAAQAPAGATGA